MGHTFGDRGLMGWCSSLKEKQENVPESCHSKRLSWPSAAIYDLASSSDSSDVKEIQNPSGDLPQ